MEITSRQNPHIKNYRQLMADKKARRECGCFPCEGAKLCMEAIKCGCELGRTAFVTENAVEKYPDVVAALKEKCEIFTIPEEIAQYISDTKAPQGIFITVKSLDKILNLSTINKCGHFLLLENLQDSGNVGTIIRTCDAFGIDGVIMSPDCADVFSPKTVRSTMGSLFRVPVYIMNMADAVSELKENGFTVYSAELKKDAVKLGSEILPQKSAVVIGNEGNGVTADTSAVCDKTLFIPMNNAESLNASVAASIIAWEMSKA